jgi:hypothetical protein
MSPADPRPQVSAEVRRRNLLTGAALGLIILLVCLIAISRQVG